LEPQDPPRNQSKIWNRSRRSRKCRRRVHRGRQHSLSEQRSGGRRTRPEWFALCSQRQRSCRISVGGHLRADGEGSGCSPTRIRLRPANLNEHRKRTRRRIRPGTEVGGEVHDELRLHVYDDETIEDSLVTHFLDPLLPNLPVSLYVCTTSMYDLVSCLGWRNGELDARWITVVGFVKSSSSICLSQDKSFLMSKCKRSEFALWLWLKTTEHNKCSFSLLISECKENWRRYTKL
jgi:hypothetical protein